MKTTTMAEENADWSNLNTELFELILKRLSSANINLRVKAVCSSWRAAAVSYVASFYNPPWLITKQPIPSTNHHHHHNACRFFSPADARLYEMRNVDPQEFPLRHCIASSGGWLVFSKDHVNLRLLNPFTGAKIQLPAMNNGRRSRIESFIVSFDLHDSKSSCVVLKLKEKLACCMHPDNTWTQLNHAFDNLTDECKLVCCNGLLYALFYSRISSTCKLVAWSFRSGFPLRVLDIDISSTSAFVRAGQGCFMESMGELLYAAPIIGEPGFAVYKLDFGTKRWGLMEDLAGRTLFLSTEGSMAVPCRFFPQLTENLIYSFIGGDYSEHGVQVYHYKTKNCSSFKQLNWEFPFWIVPNPC